MKTVIGRWGNSLSLRLSKSVAQDAAIAEGDTVDVVVCDGAIVVKPTRRCYALDDLISQITPENRHRELDWGSAEGRESW